MVGFVGGFAKNKHAFRRIFPSRWGGAAAAYFCHWPAISNRFNTRITVIAFHKSPPRGVGMFTVGQLLRDVAIWHFAQLLQDRPQDCVTSRCCLGIHLADVGIAELYTTALSGAERNLGAF